MERIDLEQFTWKTIERKRYVASTRNKYKWLFSSVPTIPTPFWKQPNCARMIVMLLTWTWAALKQLPREVTFIKSWNLEMYQMTYKSLYF